MRSSEFFGCLTMADQPAFSLLWRRPLLSRDLIRLLLAIITSANDCPTANSLIGDFYTAVFGCSRRRYRYISAGKRRDGDCPWQRGVLNSHCS